MEKMHRHCSFVQQLFCCLSIVFFSCSQAFIIQPPSGAIIEKMSQSHTSSQNKYSMNYAIVGPAGGFCEVIAKQISNRGLKSTVFFQELQGTSPVIGDVDGCMIVKGDVSDRSSLESALKGAKVVIACGDCGLKREETPTMYDPSALLTSVVEAAPSSVKTIVLVKPAEKELPKGGIFGSKTPLQALEEKTGVQKVVVTHGSLFGPLPGKEPYPFLTGPKAVPVIDESYRKKGVLLSSSDVLAIDGQTLRSSLGEAVLKFLEGTSPESSRDQAYFSIISVEDTSEPSQEAWEKEFSRLDSSKGVQVYSTEFGEIQNYDSLMRWILQKWTPNTLKNLAVVERVRSGARPVNFLETESGVSIIWETVDKDLKVVKAGKLEININKANPSLTVSRVDGSGAPLTSILPGEEEIVQNLIEGLNTVAYPRGFVVKPENVSAKKLETVTEPKSEEKASSSSSGKTRAARPGRRKTSVKPSK